MENSHIQVELDDIQVSVIDEALRDWIVRTERLIKLKIGGDQYLRIMQMRVSAARLLLEQIRSRSVDTEVSQHRGV